MALVAAFPNSCLFFGPELVRAARQRQADRDPGASVLKKNRDRKRTRLPVVAPTAARRS